MPRGRSLLKTSLTEDSRAWTPKKQHRNASSSGFPMLSWLCYSYPYPCPEKFYKLHTVPIWCLKMLYKLAWAWAWV